MSDVVIIAKAILALKAGLDSLLAFLKARATEGQRAAIGEAERSYETAKTNEEKQKAARQIQDSFRGPNDPKQP